MVSAYFHQSRPHAAIATPPLYFDKKVRTEASAGKWAVSVVNCVDPNMSHLGPLAVGDVSYEVL